MHWLLPNSPYASYEAYLADNGLSAVVKARGMDPDAVPHEVECSGLRGHGGAGFPTAVRWCTVRQNPYAPIEGLLAAAHVIEAREIYVGIEASFGREIERLHSAIAEIGAADLLASLTITFVEG